MNSGICWKTRRCFWSESVVVQGNGNSGDHRLEPALPGTSGALSHRCFPGHEVIQGLPGSRGRKLDNGRVIHKAEKRGFVWNQIEWVDQITESCNDPQERVARNLIVFAAMVRAD